MKIAILLLAHKNKEQLERLLSVLKHEDIDIFIHLDKKSPFEPSDIQCFANVVFTEQRYDVGLFEFSMVEAEFELIRTAKLHGTYQYFILMSGQCYPICSIDSIYRYLLERYPEPFIEIVAPTETNYVKKNFKHVYILKRFKLQTYDLLKRNFSYKTYRLLRYIPGGLVLAISLIKELFCKSPIARLRKMNYPSYCGSQWWILPDVIVDRVSKEYENKEFCKIVRDTFSCDETFFQTAIMTNGESSGITIDDQNNYMNRRWFYIFDHGHPITLTKEYYEEIISSGMLFARKFDITVDSEILDLIDKIIK